MALAFAFLAAMGMALALIEGLASLLLFARSLAVEWRHPLAERSHDRYDPELGWVNRPSVSLPDLYGPGLSLHTNAQGFRGREDVAAAVPPGQHRAICSGDSFTLGFGVADDQTWCHLLRTLVPGLETVNMGQGGYGVDQAYLWYKRDGIGLAHDVQILAFIPGDIDRLEKTEFYGYGKPRLALRGGKLVIENVPVPPRSYWAPVITENLPLLEQLRSVQLLRGLARRLLPSPEKAATPETTLQVALAVFDDLEKINRHKGSTLLVVRLPEQEDYPAWSANAPVARLEEALAQRGIQVVDLVGPLRALPASVVPSLFIAEGQLAVPHAAGHYTAAGNEFVARALTPYVEEILAAED